MSDSIAFPNLGIYLPHVIKSFTVFGYEIAVYGITMALGILAIVVSILAVCLRLATL
jgi:phosphatidylglycerol:prolipoprotein diacylglycerol transferase